MVYNQNPQRKFNKSSSSSFEEFKNISEISCLAIFIVLVSLIFGVLVTSPTTSSGPPPYRLLREVLAGGIAASISTLLFFPINVANIRLQTASSNEAKKIGGVFKMINIIFHSEGLQGLWSAGIVATCLKSFIHQGLRLGLFPSVKTSIIEHLSLLATPLLIRTNIEPLQQVLEDNITQEEPHIFLKIIAGMITGAISASLCSPFDLVEVLMNSEGRSKYENSIDAMYQVFQLQGYRGLWKAGTLTTFRASLASGAQLAFYDYSKDFTKSYAQVCTIYRIVYKCFSHVSYCMCFIQGYYFFSPSLYIPLLKLSFFFSFVNAGPIWPYDPFVHLNLCCCCILHRCIPHRLDQSESYGTKQCPKTQESEKEEVS